MRSSRSVTTSPVLTLRARSGYRSPSLGEKPGRSESRTIKVRSEASGEVRSATNVPSIVSASGLIEAIMTGYVQRHPKETKAYMGSVENYLSKNRILLSSN